MSEQTENQPGAEVGHPITNMLMRQEGAAMPAFAGNEKEAQANDQTAVGDLEQIEAEFLKATDTAMELALKLEQAMKLEPDSQARKARINALLDKMIVAYLEA